jgi:hypothetical protein
MAIDSGASDAEITAAMKHPAKQPGTWRGLGEIAGSETRSHGKPTLAACISTTNVATAEAATTARRP